MTSKTSEVEAGYKCQILFAGALEGKRFRSIAGSIRSTGILTVGESQWFTSDGGIIDFKRVDGRVRFDINLDARQTTIPPPRLAKQESAASSRQRLPIAGDNSPSHQESRPPFEEA